MNKEKQLIIFGTGEIAQLVHFYFAHDSNYEVVAFVADDEYVDSDNFHNLPLIKKSELLNTYPIEEYAVHVALSYKKLNQIREAKYLEVKGMGYEMPSYVCSKSVFWDDLNIGDNCFILENQTIQPTVKIGNNVMIWSGNHVGHASVIGDHSYISSHVVIAGHCTIGERCFLGVNSTIKDFTKVGNDVFVAMDASVVSNIKDGEMVISAKSEIHNADSKITGMIKKKYFQL